MAQVKKAETQQRILDAAFELFASLGYAETTISRIAQKAGVSSSNVYSYFASKLEVFYGLYEPWLKDRVLRLEKELQAVTDSRARLEGLLQALWCDIPRENGGFAVNLIQAVAMTDPTAGYRPSLLQWIEQRVAGMVSECLPSERRNYLELTRTAHLIMMAFDGFVISYHLHPDAAYDTELVSQFAAMVMMGSAVTAEATARTG